MSGGSIWHRSLVYFGLAEDESLYDDMSTVHEEPERPAKSKSVRRIDRRRHREAASDFDEAFSEEETAAGRPRRRGGASSNEETNVLRSSSKGSPANAVRVHVIAPRSYNDAQQIADRFKNGVPVIVNLQTAEPDLSRRLIDFSSGMSYSLDGAIQRIAEKVFLLTPANVEVSAEDRQRLVDQGFFNPGS